MSIHKEKSIKEPVSKSRYRYWYRNFFYQHKTSVKGSEDRTYGTERNPVEPVQKRCFANYSMRRWRAAIDETNRFRRVCVPWVYMQGWQRNWSCARGSHNHLCGHM